MSGSGPYRGRFAPSPTGPLHFGSLVAAVGSFAEARVRGGEWLVRMEDLDRPREVPGAAADILRTLEAFGFAWDGEVVYQSRRAAAYAAALAQLQASGLTYPCGCSRREIAAAASAVGPEGPIYPGTCRPPQAWDPPAASPGAPPVPVNSPVTVPATEPVSSLVTTSVSSPVATPISSPSSSPTSSPVTASLISPVTSGQAAIRLRVETPPIAFHDRVQGPVWQDLVTEVGDFVLRRADGLFAYQLAVVVDDAFQAISDVVRGADLIRSTPRQMLLQRLLGLPTPKYAHLPLARDREGRKLSKSDAAAPVDPSNPLPALLQAWAFLGQPALTERPATPAEFWSLALGCWNLARVPQEADIPLVA